MFSKPIQSFAYLSFYVCLISTLCEANASEPANQENLSPNRSFGSPIKNLDEIYGLESAIISQFSAKKRQVPTPKRTRETLGQCFEEILDDPLFSENYRMIEIDAHKFYVPRILWNIKDPLQLLRLSEGKSIVSPIKGHSFQGHHVQMRDPFKDKPAYIWVITRTSHKNRHSSLHIPTNRSQVDRSRFKSDQKRLYEIIAEEMSLDEELQKKSIKKKLIFGPREDSDLVEDVDSVTASTSDLSVEDDDDDDI